MQKTGKVARGCAVILLVGALALLVAPQAHAGALEAAKARGTLVVGVRRIFRHSGIWTPAVSPPASRWTWHATWPGSCWGTRGNSG